MSKQEKAKVLIFNMLVKIGNGDYGFGDDFDVQKLNNDLLDVVFSEELNNKTKEIK